MNSSKSKNVLIFVLLVCCVAGLNLPSTFQKCKRSDNNCLKVAIQDALPKFQNGLPDFNIHPLQPLEIPSMTIAAGKGAVNVEQKYKNSKIYNIPLSKIDNVDLKFGNNMFDLNIDASLEELTLEAEYDFNGKILMLPIVGSGTTRSKFSKLKAHLELHAEIVDRKGTKYAEVKRCSLGLNPDNLELHFDNLFNGDERLGNEMNKVLNDNWREIWNDIGVGYEEVVALIIQDICNKLFAKIPVDQIFPM